VQLNVALWDNWLVNVSIVIPTYNRPGLALSLARQIRKYEPSSEIIIVDQSEQQEDPKIISELTIIYLENAKVNTSIAKNIGLKHATGEVVFFFDDDIEITSNTLRSHLEEYSDPNVQGVAGRVINDGETVPEDTDVETGRANKYLTAFTNNFWSTRKQEVQFPYGCNMSFRRAVLEKLGGFDEKIPPPGWEETDLGLRVTRLGKMIFSPGALVYHHKAQFGGTRMPQNQWFRNYYWIYGRLIAKHVSFPDDIYSLFRLSIRILKEYPKSLADFITGFTSI
jgi:GT2 family glycosyltransferase